MKNKNILPALVPIMFGFFVMGFVDIVGISTSYVKADFASQLPEHWFGFLPSVVLVWFLVLSIPTSLLMNSIGRKNTVLLSVAITFAGMAVPFINYNLYTCLVGFAFLGIGNAVLQVSLMPLLTNVVSAQKLASAATGGQAVKAQFHPPDGRHHVRLHLLRGLLILVRLGRADVHRVLFPRAVRQGVIRRDVLHLQVAQLVRHLPLAHLESCP